MSTSKETNFSEKKYVRLIMLYWLVGIGIGIILVHLNDANSIAREQRDATYEQTSVLEDVRGALVDIRCEVEKIEQIVSGDVQSTSASSPTTTVLEGSESPDNPNLPAPPPDGGQVTGCIASPSVAPG